MRFAIILVLASLAFGSSAQSLLIRHDYINNNTEYFRISRNGDSVKLKTPIARHDETIKLEVVNFNGFVWVAETELTTEAAQAGNVHSVLDILSESFAGSASGILGTLMSTMGGGFGFGEATGSSEQRALLDRITAAREPFAKALSELQGVQEKLIAIDLAVNELRNLKFSTTLEAARIKRQAVIAVEDVFHSEALRQSDFTRLMFDLTSSVELNASRARSSGQDYQRALRDALGSDEATRNWLARQMGAPVPQLLKETDQAVGSVDSFQTYFTGFGLDTKLQQMFKLYTDIMTSDFTFTANAMAAEDYTTVKFKVFKNPLVDYEMAGADTSAALTEDQESLEPVFTKGFKVTVAGGIKVTSSVGVSFPTFGANSVEFYNHDSVITSTPGSNFSPNISTFLHFYPFNGRQVTYSGTFGIGVPVISDGFTMNFMLGGSALFGKTQRICVSAGLVSGPLTNLALGFSEGDKLSSEFDPIPVRKVYTLGAFAALTFALGSGE